MRQNLKLPGWRTTKGANLAFSGGTHVFLIYASQIISILTGREGKLEIAFNSLFSSDDNCLEQGE